MATPRRRLCRVLAICVEPLLPPRLIALVHGVGYSRITWIPAARVPLLYMLTVVALHRGGLLSCPWMASRRSLVVAVPWPHSIVVVDMGLCPGVRGAHSVG